MKILITGSAGFVGFHAARFLSARGDQVVAVDNLNDYYSVALKRARLARLGEAVRFIEMDIADADAFASLVAREQPEVILHLAAQAGVRYSMHNPFAYARSNLLGHLSVLEACRNAKGLSHLVYASSSSVYGGNTKVPFSEQDRVDDPVSLYAATKRADELMSSTYAHLYGVKQIGLRFFTVYGTWGRPDMAYWSFTDAILKRQPIRIFNNGDMMRDFTHVDDVVAGIVATLDSPVFEEGGRPHQLYNIGNNNPSPLMDVISIIEHHVGWPALRIFEPMQPGDLQSTFADITEMRRDYGFEPRVPIEDGLGEFVAWYKDYVSQASPAFPRVVAGAGLR